MNIEKKVNEILDWSQENHGMSPYLRTSLYLGITEALTDATQNVVKNIVWPDNASKELTKDLNPWLRDILENDYDI